MRRTLRLIAFLLVGAAGPAPGQFRPAGTGGVAALADALRQLGAEKRVLLIGAHPDDENTQLLTVLSRGLGAQAAYLSLTRGDGGQNLIGPELGPALGVLRSEELLAARATDGTTQFFTRAYDFGYSKSAAEAFSLWPRDSLLADVVTVIRRFQPQIIVAIFTGTPRDGHGQHQVSGLLARQAYELLRDSTWGPKKFYRSRTFDTAGTTLTIPAATLDPVRGNSYYQIAMAARSQHRSQDMGQLQTPSGNPVRIQLIDRTAPGPDTAVFAGIDTALHGPSAARYIALIDSARAHLTAWDPAAVLPWLARAHALLPAGHPHERERLERTLALAAGVAVDGNTGDGIVPAGQQVTVELSVWNGGAADVRLDSLTVAVPGGWRVTPPAEGPARVDPGSVITRRFTVAVPPDAPRGESYFLRRPLQGALYDWESVPEAVRGEPFEPPPLLGRLWLRIAGIPIALAREVVYRYRDQAVGEVRRPVFITRPFEVAVRPTTVVWPVDGGGAAASREFSITVTNRERGSAVIRLRVTPPDGWRATAPDSLAFSREDESRSITATLRAPAGVRPGTYELRVAAVGPDGRMSEGALSLVDYPHIRPRPLVLSSRIEVRAAALTLPAVRRVGYVRGASDRVPEDLIAIGVPLELLGPDSLARGDLARYDAIVIGSRAYETDPALVAANGRLLDYARSGGLVVVQYQQYPFSDGGFAPYPITIGRPHDRVTDEAAPVTVLDPAHPLFRAPNAIRAADWDGWVQERGLYFAREWNPHYTPLLEMADPGEPPLRGGLLVAPLGRGTYVYTGLSFFRQLPAAVPGAYRLFLNLLHLRAGHVP